MSQRSMTIWHYLMSRDACITIITPIVLYNIAFWWGGAGFALLLTAIYSGAVEIFNKRSGSLSVIALILVSGVSHYLYLRGYAPFAIKKENVFRGQRSIFSGGGLRLLFSGRQANDTYAGRTGDAKVERYSRLRYRSIRKSVARSIIGVDLGFPSESRRCIWPVNARGSAR